MGGCRGIRPRHGAGLCFVCRKFRIIIGIIPIDLSVHFGFFRVVSRVEETEEVAFFTFLTFKTVGVLRDRKADTLYINASENDALGLGIELGIDVPYYVGMVVIQSMFG